jgi:formate hydrogenlyase subunit 3/multisubunit Na+/H+ antiporter MnhD subunit
VILMPLAILLAALAAVAPAQRLLPRRMLAIGTIGLCAGVVALAAASLVAGGEAFGPLPLVLDPLAASFLLLLFLALPWTGTAPLSLAATGLTLLAGDGFVLAAGLLLLGRSLPRVAALAAGCLLLALSLADPSASFAAIRAAPPDAWRAAAVLLLTLAGAGAVSMIAPPVGAYLAIRVLCDLCGSAQPLWWGVPLLMAGAAILVVAACRAALAGTLHAAGSLASLHPFGLAAMALAAALFARAVDLPSVASGALAATWLALVGHVLCGSAMAVAADAVEAGAGTRRLDRLGGLIHGMPATARAALAALFSLAVLPPGLGLAAFWLLFQALLSAARSGDLAMRSLLTLAIAAVAVSLGLVMLAAMRIVTVAFLGRPRTPRTAAAAEPQGVARLAAQGLAGLAALFGLLPALALVPAVSWIGGLEGAPFLSLPTGLGPTGYSPLGVAVGLAAIFAVIRYGQHRLGERRREAPWSDGFSAAPPWLPFGDPATQIGPGSFVAPLHEAVARLPSEEQLRRRALIWWRRKWRAAAARVIP